MSLEHGMQLSMATLRVATTRHHHTDKVSRNTYHYTLTVNSQREGSEGAKAQMALKANYMISQSGQNTKALQNAIRDPREYGYPERLLANIGLSQTLPKLHLSSAHKKYHFPLSLSHFSI